LCVACAIAGWTTRSRLPATWDAVNFTLAVERIDLAQHRPHPPGYFGFVFAGRALRGIAGDAHDALELWTVLAGALSIALAVVLSSWSVTSLGWRTGLYTAALMISSVTFAFYQRVAEIYMSELLFTTGFALAAVASIRGQRLAVPVAASIWAAAAWFKISLVVMLAPAAAYVTWNVPPRQRWTMLAVFVVGMLAWLIPTLYAVGPGEYVRSGYAQFTSGTSATRIVSTEPFRALNRNARDTLRFIALTFGMGAPLAVVLRAVRGRRTLWPESTRAVMVLIALPVYASALFVHIAKPGYLLATLAIGCAYIAQLCAQEGRLGMILCGLSAATGLVHFWIVPPMTDAWTGGSRPYRTKSAIEKLATETSALTDFGYAAVQQSDRSLAWAAATIDRHCSSGAPIVVVGRGETLNWRRVMFVAPRARVVSGIPEDPMFVAQGGRFDNVNAGVVRVIDSPCPPLFVADAAEFLHGWPSPSGRAQIVDRFDGQAAAILSAPLPIDVAARGAVARIIRSGADERNR
jgi:hypothetical protein